MVHHQLAVIWNRSTPGSRNRRSVACGQPHVQRQPLLLCLLGRLPLLFGRLLQLVLRGVQCDAASFYQDGRVQVQAPKINCGLNMCVVGTKSGVKGEGYWK